MGGFERILRGVVIAGIFALPAIPFIVAGSMFFPFITGKNFTFRIVVEIVFAAWLVLAAFRPTYRPAFSLILAFLAAFVLSIGLSDVLGPNPGKSIWSNFERMEGWVTLAHLLMLAAAMMGVFKTHHLWQRFISVSVGASALMGLVALNDLYAYLVRGVGAARVDGTFGNPIYLAIYAAFHIFFTVLLMVWLRAKGWLRALLIANVCVLLVSLFFTATRGTMLGLLGGALVSGTIIMIQNRGRSSVRIAAGAVIATVLLVVGTFMAFKNTEFVQETPVLGRFASISLDSGTVSARLMIWGMALKGIAERPLIGWGQENFSFVFDKYYDPNMYAQEPWFDRTHNIVFDWLIQGGIVGALLYFAIPVVVLYYLWLYRREDELFTPLERALVTGLLAMYFFHNLFVFDNLTSYILYIVLLCFVHARATQSTVPIAEEYAISETAARTVAAPVVMVLCGIGIYLINGLGIANATGIIDALSTNSADAPGRYRILEELVSRGGLGSQEVSEQVVQTTIAMIRNNTITDPMLRQNYIALSTRALEREIASAPNSARLRLFYASFLSQTGATDAALVQIASANEAAPAKQLIKFQEAEILLQKGQFAEAKEVAESAYAVAPAYDEAALLLALVALHASDTVRARAVLVERFGTDAVDDERLIQAYVTKNVFPPVIAIFEKRVAASSTNAQARVSLAAVYLQSGNRALAIATLRQAGIDIPLFAPQAAQFIADIESGKQP